MNTVESYKAFDKDLKCKGFQYEIGKQYTLDGDIEMCFKGFHACENPLMVLNFYHISTSRFAMVEQSGEIERDSNFGKTCSSKISIIKEIDLLTLIHEGISYTNLELVDYYWKNHLIKDSFDPIRTFMISNDPSDYIRLEQTRNKINSVGIFSKMYSNSYHEQICSSGDYALIVSEGKFAEINSNGKSNLIVSTGHHSKIVVNGAFSKVVSLGCVSVVSIVSNYCEVFSEGTKSLISVIGDFTRIESRGENSNIYCVGEQCKVKAGKESYITISEILPNNVLTSKTEFVDGEKIKADTWYELNNGEFVECEPD
jgi:hypothetical protein